MFGLIVLASFVVTSLAQGASPRLVLISVDGLSPEIYLKSDELGVRVPNLKTFMEQGAYAERMTGVLPTVTYPSHTTMVTGVPPSVHGIVRNRRADGTVYQYAADIQVPTLWDRARES